MQAQPFVCSPRDTFAVPRIDRQHRVAQDAAMATASLKDRIRSEYQQLLDNFANLLRSARLPDESGDAGARQVRSWCGVPARACQLSSGQPASWDDARQGQPVASPALGDRALHRCRPDTPRRHLLAARTPAVVQGRVPGEVMEVFAEKMLQACHALLGVVAELKRNALLNDVAGRNAEVRRVPAASEWGGGSGSVAGTAHVGLCGNLSPTRGLAGAASSAGSQLPNGRLPAYSQVASSSAAAEAEEAELLQRFQQLQQRIDTAMKV